MQYLNILQFLLFAIGYFIFLIILVILHEGLHIIMIKHLRLSYYMKWLKVKGFLIAWAIYSPYFDSSFKNMSRYKQKQYFKVSIFPYLFILPLCVYIAQFNILLFLIGVMFGFANILNLPLEFVYVYDKEFKKDIETENKT